MSVPAENLFKGVAVVIDDQAIDRTDTNLEAIVASIEAGGGLVIRRDSLPLDDLEHYAQVSFVIMDWHLIPHSLKVSEEQRDALWNSNVEFIRAMSLLRHTPVVIFTNDDLPTVLEFLTRYEDMTDHLRRGRLLLKNKSDVKEDVYGALNDWAGRTPSVKTLKVWERQSLRAVNELFIDLHDKSPHWPVVLWETFKNDGGTPAEELGRLITRLVASRMDALELALDSHLPEIEAEHRADPVGYEETLKRVLEGERVLGPHRLTDRNLAAGDLFVFPSSPDALWINVRPDCDVTLRPERNSSDMYLLRGKAVPAGEVEFDDYGQIRDRDQQFTVYALYEGRAYCFSFKEVKIKAWREIKDHRKGRLLPPFSTRLQQKYAAYLQRAGLPTVPKVLWAKPPAETAPGVPADELPAAANDAPQPSAAGAEPDGVGIPPDGRGN